MKLEQAIKHLEEELNTKQDWSCVACKEEHEQLLGWLKELQAIKNSNPSEALDYMKSLFECWKNLAEKANLETKEIELEKYVFEENYDTIKQALLKAQEQEKVLNILKEKCLYNDNLNYVWCCINYDMYKEKMSELHDTAIVKIDWTCKEVLEALRILTQEEFNTVREWMK